MNFAESNLDNLIGVLAGSNPNAAASASADLASMIWSGKISETTIISWIVGSDQNLRRTASWAVWDIGGPPNALKELMALGPDEENDSVRLYCLRALIDHLPPGEGRRTRISRFLNDKNASIRERAVHALEAENLDS